MKAGKVLIILCLVLAVVAVTAGAQKKVTVGISMPFIQDSPYFFPYTEAVKKEAAARGWNLIMTDAGTDLNTQVNQIEDLVSKGVQGLMIVPLDAAGIVPVIDKMYAQLKIAIVGLSWVFWSLYLALGALPFVYIVRRGRQAQHP